MKERIVVWHERKVKKRDREKRQGYKGAIIWLTGLPSSGKSTIANGVEYELFHRGVRSYVLDGDNIRHGLNSDLGFSPKDRDENIRRIGEVARLFADAGVIAITAFISPYRKDRERARSLLDAGEFVEVFVKCSLSECESRDPKGMYQKAKRGEIPEFTGISAPYEEPLSPEIIIDTEKLPVEVSVEKIIKYMEEKGLIGGER